MLPLPDVGKETTTTSSSEGRIEEERNAGMEYRFSPFSVFFDVDVGCVYGCEFMWNKS